MSKLNPVIMIPSRLAATRLPNKPLLDIAGVPMIIKVAQQALEADVAPVYIAAGDQEIVDLARDHKINAILTRTDHASGSDRIHECAQIVDPDQKFNAVVNLQGDLPLIEPASIRFVCDVLSNTNADISTLVAPVAPENREELENINNVKAVIEFAGHENIGRALYFSRNIVPHDAPIFYHHIGIYAFKRDALNRFVALPQVEVEKKERLEQLRAMSHGMSIFAGLVNQFPLGIDTIEDYQAILKMV